jgi:hypothetical protein
VSPSELDRLAERMLAEADKIESAGPVAGRIARKHLERMVEAARSAGMGGELSAADLSRLRKTLRAIAGECAWDLGGLGNRKSWAFDQVVTALQSANAVSSPLLEAAGLNAASVRPDPDALAHAMQRLDTAFKDSSADMARAVEQQLVGMVTSGREPQEIARQLVAQNVVDPVGNMTPQARAKCIARTETMRVYRQSVQQKAAVAELKHFRCVGPLDEQTSRLCRAFIGRTLSEAEWQAILGDRWAGGEHAGRGFHPNCRHSFQPLEPSWIGLEEGDYRRTFGASSEVNKAYDADESLPAYSMQELLSMPAAERSALMADSSRGFRLRGAA